MACFLLASDNGVHPDMAPWSLNIGLGWAKAGALANVDASSRQDRGTSAACLQHQEIAASPSGLGVLSQLPGCVRRPFRCKACLDLPTRHRRCRLKLPKRMTSRATHGPRFLVHDTGSQISNFADRPVSEAPSLAQGPKSVVVIPRHSSPIGL